MFEFTGWEVGKRRGGLRHLLLGGGSHDRGVEVAIVGVVVSVRGLPEQRRRLDDIE
jgi:hypothetical protein